MSTHRYCWWSVNWNRFSGGQIILEKSLKCLYPLTHIPLSGIEYKELIKDVYEDITSAILVPAYHLQSPSLLSSFTQPMNMYLQVPLLFLKTEACSHCLHPLTSDLLFTPKTNQLLLHKSAEILLHGI